MKQEIFRRFFGRSTLQYLNERAPAVLEASENLWFEYGAFETVAPTRAKEVVRNKSIGTKLMLSFAALIGGLCMPVHAQLQFPAIAVRSNGEADVVVQGAYYFLQYYWATPGSKWNETNIGEQLVGAQPAIAVESNGRAHVVAQGVSLSLRYYSATPSSPWSGYTIAGNGTTFSSPAIAVRSNGEVDVVVQGPNNSLHYYWAAPPNYSWTEYTIAGSGTTFSSPAIAVRSNGEADIVVQGADNSLQYYWATPASPWHEYTIAGAGGQFVGSVWGCDSSPAIAVRSTGEVDVVAVAQQCLSYYWAFPGSVWQVTGLGSLETPQ